MEWDRKLTECIGVQWNRTEWERMGHTCNRMSEGWEHNRTKWARMEWKGTEQNRARQGRARQGKTDPLDVQSCPGQT